MQQVLVVGASSGIGAALAVALSQPGRTIGLVARRRDALDSIASQVRSRGATAVVEPCDVTDVAAVEASFQRVVAGMGGLDALVYSSGVMPTVGPDEFDTAKDKAMVDTNVTGAMAWLNCGAKHFLGQGRGTLCGIGSVAGDRGRRLGPAYGASKAALHTFLESLRNRLEVRGIRVVTIKPGPIDTPMAAGRPKAMLYPVDKAAARIAQAIERGEHTVYVPGKWRLIMAVVRCIPSFLFRRLSI